MLAAAALVVTAGAASAHAAVRPQACSGQAGYIINTWNGNSNHYTPLDCGVYANLNIYDVSQIVVFSGSWAFIEFNNSGPLIEFGSGTWNIGGNPDLTYADGE